MESTSTVLPRPSRRALRWHVGAALVTHVLVLLWGMRVVRVPVRATIQVQVAAPVVPAVLTLLAPPTAPLGQGPALPAIPAPVAPEPEALLPAPSSPPTPSVPVPALAPPPPRPSPVDKGAVSRRALPTLPAPPPPVRTAPPPPSVVSRRQESVITPTSPPAASAVLPAASTFAPAETASVSSPSPSPDLGHSVQGGGASTMQQAHAGGTATGGRSGHTDAGHGASAASDTVPRLLHRPKPAYPWMARQRGFEGSVTLSVELLANGTVGQVHVLASSGHSILDKAAEEAAKSWKHTPATQNGVAVTRWAKQVIDFRLNEP